MIKQLLYLLTLAGLLGSSAVQLVSPPSSYAQDDLAQSDSGSLERNFQLSWNSQPGIRYTLQRSGDFFNWDDVTTITAVDEITAVIGSSPKRRPVSWRVVVHDVCDDVMLVPLFPIIELTKVDVGGNPHWRVTWESEAGKDFKLLRSTDLEIWTEVVTLTANANTTSHIDTGVGIPPSLFWRVVVLDVTSGPVEISEIVPTFTGGAGEAALAISINSAEPIESVVFFDGDTPIGSATSDLSGNWTIPIEIDRDVPRVVQLSVEVTTEGGDTFPSPVSGVLVADSSKFIPLEVVATGVNGGGLEWVPVYGQFVGVGPSGSLEPFLYYPEGIGELDETTAVHFRFLSGALLVDSGGSLELEFDTGAFHRGRGDGSPVPSRAGVQRIGLADIEPTEVRAGFEVSAGPLMLKWGSTEVEWSGGALGQNGWEALSIRPLIGDISLPGATVSAEIKYDPSTEEFFLVACFHGDWDTATGELGFRVPEANPLKFYIGSRGSVSASGTVEITFPDGATLRGSVSWRDPIFEFSFEGRGFTVPALEVLAGILPQSDPAALIPAGTDTADLDDAADQLVALQRSYRNLALGSLQHSGIGQPPVGGAPSAPAGEAGATLRAWANWMVSHDPASLAPADLESLREIIGKGGKTAEASGDLVTVLTILRDVQLMQSANHAEIAEVTEIAAARAAAAANRLIQNRTVMLADAAASAVNKLLLGLLGSQAAAAQLGIVATGGAGVAALGGGGVGATERNKALAEAHIERRWPPAYFLDLEIVAGDTDGSDNTALLSRGFDDLIMIVEDMAELAALVEKTDLDPSQYLAVEAADQALDRLVIDSDLTAEAASLSGNFEALQAVLAERKLILQLLAALFPGAPEPFMRVDTVSLLESYQPVFAAAIAALPPARKVRIYADEVLSLLSFAQAVGFSELEGYIRENWAGLRSVNNFVGFAINDSELCNLLAIDLSLAGFDVLDLPLGQEPSSALDVTGRYEADDVDIPNRGADTLQIHQAGRYISGWIEPRRYQADGVNIDRLRLSGLLVSQHDGAREYAVQIIRENGSIATTGLFTFAVNGAELDLVANFDRPFYGNSQRHYVRVSRVPGLPDDVIELFDFKVKKILGGIYREPMHSAELNLIIGAVDAAKGKIESYVTEEDDEVKAALAVSIESDARFALKTIANSNHPLLKAHYKQRLIADSYTPPDGVPKTYWDWLFDIKGEQEGVFVEVVGLADLPSNLVARFVYELLIADLAGGAGAGVVGLGGGGMLITMKKKSASGAPLGTYQFAAVFGQAGIGLSPPVTVGQSTSFGELRTPHDYQAEDFEGAIILTGFSARGALGGGVGYSESYLHFTANDEAADTSGASINAIFDAFIGFEAGVGYLWNITNGQPPNPEVTTVLREGLSFSDTRDVRLDSLLHFEEGGFMLNQCGWQFLREFVSEYRALFDEPTTFIEINGYTDPEGHATPAEGPEDNLTLSQNRADAVRDAILVIRDLDPASPQAQELIADENVNGLGEGPARAAGVPDGAEAPEWRRVDVILNSRINFTMSAANLPGN